MESIIEQIQKEIAEVMTSISNEVSFFTTITTVFVEDDSSGWKHRFAKRLDREVVSTSEIARRVNC